MRRLIHFAVLVGFASAVSCGPDPNSAHVSVPPQPAPKGPPLAGDGPRPVSTEVSRAGELQPGATHFTVTASGEIWRDGVKTAAVELPEAKSTKHRVQDPKLILADGAMTTGDLGPLLEALISKGGCVNVSFLVTSQGREGELELPVEIAHMCSCLSYYAGAVHYDEHGTTDWSHLWISARPGPLTITAMEANRPDAVYFPDADEDTGPKEPPPKPEWSAEKQPEGALTANVLRAFFDRETIKAARPVVVLDVPPETRLLDLLKDMATIRESGVLFLVWIRPRR